MKNLLLGLVAFLMLSFNLDAQDYTKPVRTFKKGQTDLQIGYGLLATSVILDGAKSKLPPITIKADRFFGNKFTLGVSYMQSAHETEIIVPDGIKHRLTNNTHQAAVRMAFHLTDKLKNADLYGGFLAGVNFEKFTTDQNDFEYLSKHMGIQPENTKVAYTAFIGGRYVIGERWSAFGEIGFSSALLSVGFGYRI